MLTASRLSITIIVILLKSVNGEPHRENQSCGGRLKGPVGTIHTPNFPNPFPVPIKCKWIIEHDIVNGTISIYFTQQYITSGLTFTEYMYYDDTYKLGERRALTVTEENITRIKYLQVQSPVLVVELTLDRLEGTQLRALGLLQVFGLNVTFAVRPPAQTPAQALASCSAIECRLLGHCYASSDFTEFSCSCFEGYSGPDCGVGPLCPTTSNLCKNKGICRQMGPAAVSCICAPGYTGDLCESEIAAPECGIEECSEHCKEGKNCDCNPKDSDSVTARFETKLQIADTGNANITKEVTEQITDYLRVSNITLQDEIEVLNISSANHTSRTVWLRVWGLRRQASAVRTALARLASRGTDSLRLLPVTLHFEMQPALSLHKLIINQHPEVWEGAEFILSCMSYGSPSITFTWYKDGVRINFEGTTRGIWKRTVAEDALGRRMSVLGVSSAKKLDSGKWSCAAEDAGRRRCSALRITVLRPPNIILVPSTLTLNKGDNVSITCLAGAGRMHGTLGFSWAREKSLLALAPGREVWEDLYPAGSVLKLYNVQKSGEYTCQVSSAAGANSKSVTVWALSPTEDVCPSEPSHGIRWPQTAPGAHTVANCPTGYAGETTRFCEPKTIQSSVKWAHPNFSGCIDESLQDTYEQFTRISYGYSWMPVNDVLRQYGSILRSLPGHPGAATVPLHHSLDILNYLLSPVAQRKDRELSAEPLLRIYDMLLKYPDGFLDEQKIYDLQNAIVDTATMKEDLDFVGQEYSAEVRLVLDKAHFIFPLNPNSEEWLLTSMDVEVEGQGNVSMAVVNYKDLSSRLPSLRRSFGLKGGREVEYNMASSQSQVRAYGGHDAQYIVTLLFTHAKNYTAIESKLACAVRTATDPSTWDINACEVRVPEPSHISCRCRGLATYALFTIARSTLTDAERDLGEIVKVTVGLGGALCLMAAFIQLLTTISGGPRLPSILRMVTAASNAAALLTLLECDTRQEESCPGVYGWICAASWCIACAALCAQPLLLQAELAGRPQRASSIGILAGFGTIVWLCARLWGGAPLQLGSGAQLICAGGCTLLTLLCTVLAFCAAYNMRIVKRKVPAERRTYLSNRIRIVRHTLILLVTTSAAQMASIAYAQPGDRKLTLVAGLAVTALADGLSMFLCYVLCDDDSIQLARRLMSLPSENKHRGDTTLSLYIAQSGEVESLGFDGSSPVTPLSSYWRFDSPSKIHRNSQDSRADIVRSTEYTASPHNPRKITTRALCDLIPQPDLSSTYIELKVPKQDILNFDPPNKVRPFKINFTDLNLPRCTLCQSNPDISLPIKSCLKKPKIFTSSISLPAEENPKTNIELINIRWNQAYDSPTDQMINKISHDLDFLLNRKNKDIQIQEAPT
ncbi:uncharacterized protein LOC110994312 isoform X1 [Pieris rapae]|uniref:uncharacterized protein LOC110994312 isoform X1 n=2 Tax=Pieris rapae TaxID=64459 RepID=UPI001E27EE2D|nr:uncharacterized protein LOC110994312 isoform X1 [Pieris rapae]